MRRAQIRTEHGSPEHVAAAVRPDNTDQMTTRVADGAVVTTIERDSTSGLQSTVDDYVVNVRVAAQLTEHDTDSDSDLDSNNE